MLIQHQRAHWEGGEISALQLAPFVQLGESKSAETAKKIRQFTKKLFFPPIWRFVALFS